MTNFGNVLTLVAPQNVQAGDGVVVGSIFGVAAHDAANGDQVDCQVVGIFDLTKVNAQAWAQGNLVYWDQANNRATTAAAGNIKIGVAVQPAANGSAAGQVRLNGAF